MAPAGGARAAARAEDCLGTLAPRARAHYNADIINKLIDQITEPDIDDLVKDGEPESRTIEYKSELPGGKDDDKREFLADASAFANTSGGDIIYGVEAEKGIPVKVLGLPDNMDDAILRLESMLRSGLEPVLLGIRFKTVARSDGRPVLVLRVPKSWLAPHRVTFRGHDRFYVRTSAGKDTMDVAELRAAFALSESLPEKLRRFRRERLALIASGETPAPLLPGAKVVLHIVPVAAFDAGTRIDGSALAGVQGLRLMPIGSPEANYRFNFDGFLAYRSKGAYLQVFRTGALEAVMGPLCAEGYKTIPGGRFASWILDAVGQYLPYMRDVGIVPPVFLLVSLLGVKGHTMGVKDPLEPQPIDRDDLLLPDVVVNDFADDLPKVLKPRFDTLWQAAGLPGSPNYDEQGKPKLR